MLREKRGRERVFSINTSVAEDFLAAAWGLYAKHGPKLEVESATRHRLKPQEKES